MIHRAIIVLSGAVVLLGAALSSLPGGFLHEQALRKDHPT